MGIVRLGSIVAAAGTLLVSPVAANSAGTVLRVRTFHTPSRNISCELDWHRAGVTNGAYCQTYQPPRAVTLRASGAMRVCSNCIGNEGEGTPTLAYGRSVVLGPFRCTSMISGVRCTVPSGRGFVIARSGVRRF